MADPAVIPSIEAGGPGRAKAGECGLRIWDCGIGGAIGAVR
jgi:hypothetical protein